MIETPDHQEPQTDEELARLVLAGEIEAFARLYEHHYVPTYRLAYRMTGQREAAEDLTQEIFFRMHQKLSHFSGNASFSTWFYRLAVNCSLNYRRRERTNPHLEVVDNVELLPMPHQSKHFETSILQQQIQVQVQRALLSIKPKLRMTFILKDIEGLNYEQIAEQMNCSVGTVASRLSHARILLARKLEHLRGAF